jgi:phosphatidylinositol glycan class C protein
MNAAVSASVVLASRLADNLSVFALVLFSVQLFALYPMLRRRFQVRVRCVVSLGYRRAEPSLDRF